MLAVAPRVLPEDTRRANRSLLLRALHHGGPASRADLAKLVGLTPATVSSVVRELVESGLVDELGRISGGIGKPATMVGIEPDGRHIVALDLSEPERFHGALVDLSGRIVERRSFERDGATGGAALDRVAAICAEMVAAAERPLLGVGIATPGIVDQDGVVLRAARLEWRGQPVADLLAAESGVPVHVANDANAAAVAELTFGTGESADLLLVRVDQGVGAGLVLDGALYRGAYSAAGEIGHVVVDPDGAPCACGKRGCLETEIAAPVLDEILSHATPERQAEAIRRAGGRLGVALAPLISALDVIDVVISGPPPINTEAFREAAADEVAARTMPEIGGRLTIRPSAFGGDDVVLGAAALVLDHELGIR